MRHLDRHDRVLMARRQRSRAERSKSRPWFWISQGAIAFALALLLVGGGIVGGGAALAFSIYTNYAEQLPDASVIEQQQDDFQTVRIYDRTGAHLLYESVDPRPFRGDRTFVALDGMSPWVWKAAVALEDRNFFENPGINVRGLFRAFFSNLQGGVVQGGSSITQQLIKNVVIPPEERARQEYARKIKEVILALEVTRRYPKEKILEWYLNYNFYGNLAYGVEAASQVYFGKSSVDLTLAEAAMLAAIPQYPGLNPIDNPEDAKRRQGITLNAMAQAGMITQAEANQAFAVPLVTKQSIAERFDILTAPHFALYVLERIKNEFNTANDPYVIWKRGLEVYTTLDVGLQQYAEQVAREQVAKLEEQGKNASNAAIVVIRNDTGEILAMVGSLDYNNDKIDGQVNVATSERQPGSSFKPYVYLTALEEGKTAASMVLDVATAFPEADGSYYRPENYDRQYHGPVSLRNALARSYNIPAIRVMADVGIGDALRTAHRMGINGLNRGLGFYGLSLVLGGGEVTLLDHTYAFSVLGNLGTMNGEPVLPEESAPGFRNLNPVAVLQVRDSAGNVLKKYEQPSAEQVVQPDIAFVLADVMSDDVARAPAFGANTELTLPDRKVAAKTGTTNGFKDNWTMGFTPQFTVGVWVGNTDNESMENVTGLSGAAPIWNAIMRKVHEGQPVRWYERPPGIIDRTVCTPSGLLPTPSCPGSSQRNELFVAGTEPTMPDNIWQSFEVNGAFQSYMILPSEAADWVRESGIAQPPGSGSPDEALVAYDPDASITSPTINGYISGQAEIKGNARGGPHTLSIGRGLDPTEWTQIGSERGEEVVDGTLQTLDTGQFGEGLYTLRLVVRREDGERVWTTPVTIDHTPPSVVLSEPAADRLYVMEEHEQININALVNDTWAVGKVEFYVDNAVIGTATVPPFNERWKITMRDQAVQGGAPWPAFASNDPEVQPGTIVEYGDGFAAVQTAGGVYLEGHKIKVRAYDRAGNVTASEEVRVWVRHEKNVQ